MPGRAHQHDRHPAPGQRRALTMQALQHADEHRAHVCTVPGASGLPVPAVDAWAYGQLVV